MLVYLLVIATMSLFDTSRLLSICKSIWSFTIFLLITKAKVEPTIEGLSYPLCCKFILMFLPHHHLHFFQLKRCIIENFLLRRSFLDSELNCMWDILVRMNISIHPYLTSLGSSYSLNCSLQTKITCDNLFGINVLQGIPFPSHINIVIYKFD